MGLATETAAFSTAPAARVACADDAGANTGLLLVVVGSAADRGTATTSTNRSRSQVHPGTPSRLLLLRLPPVRVRGGALSSSLSWFAQTVKRRPTRSSGKGGDDCDGGDGGEAAGEVADAAVVEVAAGTVAEVVVVVVAVAVAGSLTRNATRN